ncbi:uncharacterized protein [Ptychodera flava]|uniref:uncharacterized protein isoform X2 n=1 Tax=Ptychodera flava TaxID=63121 RepID=UPI003969EFEA
MAEVPDTEDFVLGEAEVDEDVVYTSVRHHIKELQKLRKPDCEAAVEVKPGTQSSTQVRHICKGNPDMQIYSDASSLGWGAAFGNNKTA